MEFQEVSPGTPGIHKDLKEQVLFTDGIGTILRASPASALKKTMKGINLPEA